MKTLVSSDIEEGISIAPPIPQTAIPAISSCASGASAATAEPAAKSAEPATSRSLRPKMSARRPAAIRSAAKGM